MSSKKIWQYPEATSITNDDYILMDSNTETGSQCLKANKIGAVHITKTVTERKVYKASDDNANGFSEVTVAVPYTDVHYDKDDIVSFVGEDLPLKSVTAYIEPQQDLHGYDAPWVGGAGKNKFAGSYYNNYMSENNGVFTNTESDTQSVFRFIVQAFNDTDLIASSSQEVISSPGRYYVSINIPSSGTSLKIKHNGSSKDIGINCQFTATGTFTISLNVTKTNPSTVGGLEFKDVQIESGSQMTSYAPYSNICPISGWTEAEVSVSGKNLFNPSSLTEGKTINSDGSIDNQANRSATVEGIPIQPNSRYTISYVKSIRQGVFYYDKDDNFISFLAWGNNPRAFLTPSNAYYVRFSFEDGTAPTNVMLSIGETAQPYTAYNGHTYTIDLDGTRYGGTLDVVSGVLTVDRVGVIFDGSSDEGWTKYNIGSASAYAMKAIASGIKSTISEITAISNYLTPVASSATWGSYDCFIATSPSANNTIFTGVRTITDVEAWKAYLASNNLQVVYELATPLTFNLDEVSISNLVGDNNFWADTGEIAVEWQTLYVTPTT